MTTTPKVLHVVVAGDIGGAERLIVDLASRPEATGVTHAIALFSPNPRLLAFFEREGLEVIDYGRVFENPLSYLWRSLGPTNVAWLARLIERTSARIVHMHTLGSHVLGVRAARRTGRPSVRTEHHIVHYEDPSASAFTRWAAQRTDRIVTISAYVHAFVRRTEPGLLPRLVLARNGVDIDRFSPKPMPERGGPTRFVVACRLERWKGVHLAIEALSRVPSAELLVVGDGSERTKLSALASRLGVADRVEFVGYQADTRPFLAQAHVGLSASDAEPLGLSILETLAVGRPVVAFADGGVPEIVQAGATGFLAPVRTVDALAEVMQRAVSARSELSAMGAAARRFVETEASITAMCRTYGEVYRSLLRGDAR